MSSSTVRRATTRWSGCWSGRRCRPRGSMSGARGRRRPPQAPRGPRHRDRGGLRRLRRHLRLPAHPRGAGALGYRRGPELVRAVMRDLGLVACQPVPWRPVTTMAGDAADVPDLLERDFAAASPGTKLVGDITYTRTWQGWLYLATVIDCATKACIGYAMAEHMRTELVTDALHMAATRYGITGAILHSDRGAQYMSDDFSSAAGTYHLRRSVGRTGVCYDNAQAETFNAAVKVRASQPHSVSDTRTRPQRRGPVHRIPLQSEASALRTRLPHPGGGLQRLHRQKQCRVDDTKSVSGKRGAAHNSGGGSGLARVTKLRALS